MYWGGVRVIGLKDIDLGIPDDADTSMYQTEADFLNDNIGHLNEKDGINCPICKNRGYFYAMVKAMIMRCVMIANVWLNVELLETHVIAV